MLRAAWRTGFAATSLGIFLLASTGVDAQWLYKGAPEPVVRGFRAFANTPTAGTTTLVAATLGGGVFKGTDANNGTAWNWQARNNGITNKRLHSLLATDSAGNTMYVGSDGDGIFRTTNGGDNWAASNGTFGSPIGCKVVRAISNPFGTPTTLYAGTGCRSASGVYRSTDSGGTWTRLGGGTMPSDVIVSSVNVPGGTTLFAATLNYGIFKSTDSGANWTAINNGIPGTNPTAFNVLVMNSAGAPITDLVAYIAGAGVFRSSDGGANWTASNTGLPSDAVALAGLGREGQTTTLYIPLDKQGFYRSTDGGATWSAWSTVANVLYPRGLTAMGANVYYAFMVNGVTKTTNGGSTWSDYSSAMLAGAANAIEHDSRMPATMYATAETLFKIPNLRLKELSGAMIDNGITGTTFDGIVQQDRSTPNTLYVTTNNRGVFKSTDGGANWTAINSGLPASLVGQSGRLVVDRSNPQTLYVGFIPQNLTNAVGVYKSTNGGTTWASANTGLSTPGSKTVYRVEVDRNNSSVVYLATRDGLYKSTDGAGSWSLIYSATDGDGNALRVSNVRMNHSNSQEVFIANAHQSSDGARLSSSGLQKSSNGGATWTNMLPGELVANLRILKSGLYAGLSSDPGEPETVLRSLDGGTTWQPYSGGLAGDHIRTFGTDGSSRMLSLSLQDGIYALNLAQTDFNGDGRSDILWRNSSTGQVFRLLLDGFDIVGGTQIYSEPNTAWKIVGDADFDANGTIDLMWRNDSTGMVYFMSLDGNGLVSGGTVVMTEPNTAWRIIHTPDLNGDGKADLLWWNASTGQVYAMLMNGGTIDAQDLVYTEPNTDWKIVGVGDFGGGGKANQLLWRNGTTGQVYLMTVTYSSGIFTQTGTMIYQEPNTAWKIISVADFDGDGRSDILWRNDSTGQVYVMLMNGGSIVGGGLAYTEPNLSWNIVATGDYNSDGNADLLWRNSTTGQVYMMHMSGAAIADQRMLYQEPNTSWKVLGAREYGVASGILAP